MKLPNYCCLLLLLVACKKPAVDTPTDDIVVKEYKTNTPLPGVLVSLFACTQYDFVFGCRSVGAIGGYYTDANGIASISQYELSKATSSVKLTKPGYWDQLAGGAGLYAMMPEAYMRIMTKPTRAYPDTAYFAITTGNENGKSSYIFFKKPKDSTFIMRLAGGVPNTINWVVYTALPLCLFNCPRDTLAYGSMAPVTPDKSATINVALNY